MLLNQSLIIAYSTPNYVLKDDFLLSIKDIGVEDTIINLFIDNELLEQGIVNAHTEFWIQAKINKLKNLIKVLTENKNNDKYKYFISSDCDIWFLKENISEWDSLQEFIDISEKDVFFMKEDEQKDGKGGFNINTGFFIIKNNNSLLSIINFFNFIFYKINIIFSSDHSSINEFKCELNFDYIPNQFVIWANHIFDNKKSLFHHPVCCNNISSKKTQILQIKKKFQIYTKTFQIIIAKYKEDIEWINYLDKSKVIIYDKSDFPLKCAISRPNIGRDPETLFYHIIQNYENLPDFLIFMQGNPFPHFVDKIEKENLSNKLFEILEENIITLYGLFSYLVEENIQHFHNSMKFSEYFSYFFKNPCPPIIHFIPGCQYVLSKKNILARPKHFYQKIHDMIINSKILTENQAHYQENEFDPNSISVWCLERLLFYIFNPEYIV
jgi:hypothetical protein